jgi:hypothetical protein
MIRKVRTRVTSLYFNLLNKPSSVAELAEMPLYRVTCGDIGTDAEAVEKYLQTILYLGKTWNCGKQKYQSLERAMS